MSAAPRVAAAAPSIVEVKRQLDGRVERYECELVDFARGRVVVLFRIGAGPGRFGRGPLDSYGFFWSRRPYNAYHVVEPGSGIERATRFDVVRDVELPAEPPAEGGAVAEFAYTDLLLDLWVRPGEAGRATAEWEDEDELADALERGLLTAEDGEYIERARGVLERGQARIRGELRRELRGLGRI